jgi:pimeloyl-ACP methyl ester carboxylesterase
MSSLDRLYSWRGRSVAWERAGSGPPVVFCHGTPWSSALWRPFADALSRDFTVYLWDMPGYGMSSKEPGHPVDLDVQGQLLADLLTTWGLDAPHVVAHDFGGAVSLRAHLLHGCPVASLLLVDVVALRPWGSPFFNLVKDHPDVFARLPEAVHAGALRAYIAGASHRGLTEVQLDELAAPWLTEQGRPAFYRQIAQADERFTDDFAGRLHGVRAPVRIVWGEDDTWIPVARARSLRDAIPGSTLRLLSAAGHLVQLDAPIALADELRAWLDQQGDRTGTHR